MEVSLGRNQQNPDGIVKCHNGFPKGGVPRSLSISLGKYPSAGMTEEELSVLLTRFLMHPEARERLSTVQGLALSSGNVSIHETQVFLCYLLYLIVPDCT